MSIFDPKKFSTDEEIENFYNKLKEKNQLNAQVGGEHYKNFKIQPIEFCHANKLGVIESNVVKYVCRHTTKGGKEDIEKAIHYLKLLLQLEYGDK